MLSLPLLPRIVESLDDMTEYICNVFGNVLNKNVVPPHWDEHPYGSEQLRKRVYAVPVKDIRRLTLIWPCPDLNELWESMVRRYIAITVESVKSAMSSCL